MVGGEGVTGAVSVAPVSACRALAALTRPPVTVIGPKAATGSADLRIAALRSATLAAGRAALSSAATPAVTGLAKLVPSHCAMPKGACSSTCTARPGAITSTVVRP